jgi:hypothetical protein
VPHTLIVTLLQVKLIYCRNYMKIKDANATRFSPSARNRSWRGNSLAKQRTALKQHLAAMAHLKLSLAGTTQLGLTGDGVIGNLADTIRRFRASAARTLRTSTLAADRIGVVVHLHSQVRSQRGASDAQQPLAPPQPCAGPPESAQDLDPVLVAVLRESVARGEYTVDPERVARKLMAADGL